MLLQQRLLSLPGWIGEWIAERPAVFPTLEERVRLAIDLARENTERATGGPFGAAIFERDSGRLVAVGVNRVVPLHCSVAHAEIMAIAMAQGRLATFDLGKRRLPAHELVTSAQMCSMCFGATLWSGVRRVVWAATAEDVERLTGFDEGPLPDDWEAELTQRGIEFVRDVLRDEACEVLAQYKAEGGVIYNGRSAE